MASTADPSGKPNPFEPPAGAAESAGIATPPPRRGRLTPSKGVWLAVAAFVVLAGFIRWRNVTGDAAAVNILTFACGLVSCLILSTWFVFFSGYARRIRFLSCVTALAAVGLGIALFRVEHVSGELVPTFRPRWSKKADELLARPAAEASVAPAESVTATSHDFPQFLGPHRNARVDNVELDRDWQGHPPKLLWRQPIGAGWSAFATLGQVAVTLEQRGTEEFVTCYDIPTGKLIWSHATQARHETIPGGIGPRSTPTLHGGRVYAQGAAGELLCLDILTGRVIWRDNLLTRYKVPPGQDEKGVAWGRSGSPLIVDDLVIVPAGGPAAGPKVSLAAFQKDTGALVWEGGQHQVSYASPVLATLAGVRQILSVNEATVSGHDPGTGKVLWETSWPGNSTQNANASQPVPVGNNRLFLSKAYGWGSALYELSADAEGSLKIEQLWHDRTLFKTKFTNVVVYQDHVYGLSDGTLECAELATGQRRWKKGRYGQGQILGVGGLILVQEEVSGEVAMVEATPAEYRELGRFPALDGKTWNNLCLSGKRLLVRNAEEAACYDLP